VNQDTQALAVGPLADPGFLPEAEPGTALGTAPDESVPGAAAAVDGRSARWAEHRERRRAEMLDVARRLIHAQGPDVTMEDIAAASGTSKSIVYRYFTDKAQLQRAIGMHILTGMHRRLVAEVAQVEADPARTVGPAERIHAMIAAYVDAAEMSPNVYRFITRPSEGLNHFLASVARLVATAVPAGTDPRLAAVWAAGAVGFVQGAVDRWMADAAADNATATAPASPSRPTPDELTESLVAWLIAGIAAGSEEDPR